MTDAPTTTSPPDVGLVQDVARDLESAIGRVIQGKNEVIRTAITVLLAGGHLLLEDVPGVGKTVLAKALGRAVNAQVKRVQFTPDLLPSDLTGVSVFNQESRAFEFKPGPLFCNILLGDEINRASPKTQSALLECMEEGQVTVDGTTYHLDRPYLVMATQNPVEMDGTFPLPEAQLDRFMAKLSMGYPSPEASVAMLSARQDHDPLASLEPVTTVAMLRSAARLVEHVQATDAIRRYIVDLAAATRTHRDVRLGASPRATLHLIRAAQASAAMQGRGHVLPDDVQALAPIVLTHRLLLNSQSMLDRRTAADVVIDTLQHISVHRTGF